jgi:hypothetical protein
LPQQDRKKSQLTEEQRKARELKLLNARKYFEMAKLMYLQHVCGSLALASKAKQTHSVVLARWLSLLSPSLLIQYSALKRAKPLSVSVTDLLGLLRRSKGELEGRELEWSRVFWAVCLDLRLACRKVHFFEVDSIVEEVFFQLKYHSSELQRKKESKKVRQYQAMKMELEQQMEQSMQSLQSQEDADKYLFLEDYEFDESSFKSKQRAPNLDNSQQQHVRREHNFMRKRNFRTHYFQLFDPSADQWVLLNAEILEPEHHETARKTVLEGKFVIGFYAVRQLHLRPEFAPYTSLRPLGDFLVEDLTMYFEDSNRHVLSRRKRLGLKWIMRHVFEEGSFPKSNFVLDHYDAYVLSKNDKIELEYQLTVFPRNRDEMMTSPYFMVPSQLPKYCILDPAAQPVPDIEFNQERVYLRRDTIAVTSRLFWIDRGRKVKPGEAPVKTTENKSKNVTELFLYEQTMPFEVSVDPETGGFIADDEFNSIYVPSDFVPPPGMSIVRRKISMVCSKARIRHVKLVQGFSRSMGRMLPNEIGYLVYLGEEEEILRLFEERQAKLEESKSRNRLRDLSAMWNKLFKKIELREWSNSFQPRS